MNNDQYIAYHGTGFDTAMTFLRNGFMGITDEMYVTKYMKYFKKQGREIDFDTIKKHLKNKEFRFLYFTPDKDTALKYAMLYKDPILLEIKFPSFLANSFNEKYKKGGEFRLNCNIPLDRINATFVHGNKKMPKDAKDLINDNSINFMAHKLISYC